ncbi:MAG: 4-hydroxybenzoate octaprenyltransferase [Candidatus Berkiella sp.]
MAILAHLTQRLYQYGLLMRVHRPVGILLLLWPTLMALWIASNGHPQPVTVLIFTLGVIVMRSAGCVINDYADKDFDGHVTRTKGRPIVQGHVSSTEALGLFLVLVLLAFLLVCCTNVQTVLMSLGALILATLYPFMKRYTHFPQVVLGAAYGWAIPMAFCVEHHPLSIACWLLYLGTLLWAMAYDTLYAMVDKEDDLNIGVKSTAIAFGQHDKLMVWICHMFTLGTLVILGWYTSRGLFFFLGISAACCLALYQQWLIRNNDKDAFFRAFLNNQWLGFALFAGTFLDFAL